MAAAPVDGVDPEPFSPSVFLDLPPTPRPDGGDAEDLVALPDHLVLPYISRILMEEDIDDGFFYHYPDHPVLLQAQEAYAQILSDATADFSSDVAAAATSAGSYAATTASSSSGTFTLSPSSSDIPAFANATWPYDPFELTQLLAAGDANAGCLPGGGEASLSEETNTVIPASTSVLFSGQNRVNMDMLNRAFLKGKEEANKFLPTNNGLPMAISGAEPHVFATGETEKKGMVDGMPMFQWHSASGRGRKNMREWNGLLEVQTGMNSKLMVPEPEETGETVDQMVFDGYAMCLDNMKSLRITVGHRGC